YDALGRDPRYAVAEVLGEPEVSVGSCCDPERTASARDSRSVFGHVAAQRDLADARVGILGEPQRFVIGSDCDPGWAAARCDASGILCDHARGGDPSNAIRSGFGEPESAIGANCDSRTL